MTKFLLLITVPSEPRLHWSALLGWCAMLYTGCHVFWDTSRQTGRLILSIASMAWLCDNVLRCICMVGKGTCHLIIELVF